MKLSSKCLLLLFALAYISRSHYDDHVCSHHQHQSENPPEFLDVEEDFSLLEGRTLASSPRMRIHANYDNLKSSASSSYLSYVRNDVAPPVIDYFQAALRVKYPVSGALKVGSSVSTLCGMKTPSELKSGVNADYYILFDSRSESSTVVATSKYCYLASGSNRPLIATTNFNRQMFIEAKGDVILHEKNIYLLLHEMMHTFGFSSNLYKYFINSSGKKLTGHVKQTRVAGVTHAVLDVPVLTNKLKKFHGCSSLPGAIMEDDGGSGTDGSHFERKLYYYENMVTGSHTGKRVSELSLTLLESSGWYAPDYSYAEPYFFGQGTGCNFINNKCGSNPSFDEFCSGSARGCSAQGHSGGKCSSDDKTEGCRIVVPDNDFYCENEDAQDYARFPSLEVYGRGAGSKCFSGDLNSRKSSSATSFCFKYECSGSGSGTQLEVFVGGKAVECKREGKMSVDGYYGSIDCPDPQSFCETTGKKYCPRACMGRGNCVNGRCQCQKGSTGVDCALRA